MAKCPKCASRKGKRACPALGQEICPVCCAEGRLRTIACPESCPHLQSEFYQQRRRKDRALSRGKDFVDMTREICPAAKAFDFAFKLQADIHFFLANQGDADDATVSRCLDELKNVASPIFVPSSALHPLTAYLLDRWKDERRYPEDAELPATERLRIVRDIARRVEKLAGAGSHRYRGLLAEFFGSLDFEADLDYSPLDEKTASGQPPRSSGGLILPFSEER